MKPTEIIRGVAAQANLACQIKRAMASGRSHNPECEACQ